MVEARLPGTDRSPQLKGQRGGLGLGKTAEIAAIAPTLSTETAPIGGHPG